MAALKSYIPSPLARLTLRWPSLTPKASLRIKITIRPARCAGARYCRGHAQIRLGNIENGIPGVESLVQKGLEILRDAKLSKDGPK